MKTETCKFDIAWIGRCKKTAVENGMCEEHAKEKCVSCGAPATHQCSETGQFVCGAPLCDDCEHTTAMEGTNGNIGFFRTSPLPEGMKEHCKKCDQKVFPWYVTSMKKDYPYFVEVLDKFDKGELTYLEADKLLNDFIVEKNREEEEARKNKIIGMFILQEYENGDVLAGDEYGETHFYTKQEWNQYLENIKKLKEGNETKNKTEDEGKGF